MNRGELYLNHAGTSWPKPAVVSEAVQEAMTAAPSQWSHRFDQAHQSIADFFGVRRREQILLTPGCTSALAIGIGDALIPTGKRILTSHWEHHALHRPLLKLASSGHRVDYIPAEQAGPEQAGQTKRQRRLIDLGWLERELAKEDVGLVAITAACNVTGERLPYQEVIRIAHQYQSMVLVDAAQIVGWCELDLPRLGADMVAFGGHKGLQAPWGIGGLYLSDHAQMECTSASCNLPVADKGDGIATPRPGYCDVGSVDQCALAGLHAAIEMLNQQNIDSLLAKGHRQIQRIRKSLEQIAQLRFFGPAESNLGMPTLALGASECSNRELAKRFHRHGVVVGSGIHCAPLVHQSLGTQDSGLVRLSVGLGQPDEEIDDAIDRMQLALDE